MHSFLTFVDWPGKKMCALLTFLKIAWLASRCLDMLKTVRALIMNINEQVQNRPFPVAEANKYIELLKHATEAE